MNQDRGPASAAWILEGGATLLRTLRSTDPVIDMWAWGSDQHVRFWSRRQLHETVIHRVDLELAAHKEPTVDEVVALDGIDEFLVNLPSSKSFSAGATELMEHSGQLAFSELDGGRRWHVDVARGGMGISRDGRPADVELTANGRDLLLVLYRRRHIDEANVGVAGDRDLLDFWLEHSALL
jgi:uncharacterized protein (TIGR03083 family)